MALTDEQYEKIDRYFSGLMQPGEQALFFDQLASNEEWHEEFELQKFIRGKQDIYQHIPAILAGIDKKGSKYQEDKLRLEKIIRSVEDGNSIIAKKQVTNRIFSRRWLVAASILLFLLLASSAYYFFYRTNKPGIVRKPPEHPSDTSGHPDQDTLKKKGDDPAAGILAYENYYTRYEPGDEVPVELQSPAGDYLEGKTTRALDQFIMMSGTRSLNTNREKYLADYALFFKGLCYLDLDRPGEASDSFKSAYEHQVLTGALYDDLLWYYAMASLKLNNLKQAAVLLRKIDPANLKYSRQLQELSESIITK